MFRYLFLLTSFISINTVFGWDAIQAITIDPSSLRPGEIQLKNDTIPDAGGQGFLQEGFVAGEKAAVWLKVPTQISKFKTDYFRVILASSRGASNPPSRAQIFFQMQTASGPQDSVAAEIENAADVTPGPYWNDIPAQGASGGLPCVNGGQYIGAAIEFTKAGLPSVMRDFVPMKDPRLNLIFAIPGGWQKSLQLGVQGDWVLRAVGHQATPEECSK